MALIVGFMLHFAASTHTPLLPSCTVTKPLHRGRVFLDSAGRHESNGGWIAEAGSK